MSSVGSVTKSLPFHQQVYEILRKAILDGKYQPGERLYENKISLEFNVSRSPVREALRMLEQDELVVAIGNGLVVNPLELEDLEELYQCRMAVEPFAAKLASTRLSEDDLEKLEGFIEEADLNHNKKDFGRVIQVNTLFHDLIIQNCENARLIGIIEKISTLIILSRLTEFQCYQRDTKYLDEHRALLQALKDRDGDRAEMVLRNHISNDFTFQKEMNLKNLVSKEQSEVK